MALFLKKLFILFATLLMVMMINCHTSKGEEFEIMWYDTITNSKGLWSTERKVHVGDTLDFLYYGGWEEVYQVTRESYEICNYQKPIATLTNSILMGLQKSKLHVKDHGHFYFVVKWAHDHGLIPCQDIRKLHVYVPKPPCKNAQLPSPSSYYQSTSNVSAPSPPNNPNNTSDAPTPRPSSNHLSQSITPTPAPNNPNNTSDAPTPTPSSNHLSQSYTPTPAPSSNYLNTPKAHAPSPSSSSSNISPSYFIFGLVIVFILF